MGFVRSSLGLLGVLFWFAQPPPGQVVPPVPGIEVIPAAPSSEDQISLLISGIASSSCTPGNPRTSIVGSVILVSAQTPLPIINTFCLAAFTPWQFTIPIGRLSARTYRVVLTVDGKTLESGFTVSPGLPDDHDDGGAVQVGYAVITPSSVTNKLVVFETFGLKRGGQTTQTGVLPAEMTTDGILFLGTNSVLSRNLGLAIVNPGSTATDVTLRLRTDDGALLSTKNLSLAARQQTALFATELFTDVTELLEDLTGTLSITSTGAVSVLGLRFRGSNFSTLPLTNLSTPAAVPQIAEGVGGAGAVVLPHFLAGGGWATEIVIANVGSAPMTVRLDLFKQDGKQLAAVLNRQAGSSFTDLSVPANGVVILAPRDSNGNSRF